MTTTEPQTLAWRAIHHGLDSLSPAERTQFQNEEQARRDFLKAQVASLMGAEKPAVHARS